MKTIAVLEVIGLLLVWLLIGAISAPLKLVVWVLRGVVRRLDAVGGRLL